MKGQKSSRLDRCELAIADLTQHIIKQDSAIRYLLTEVQSKKVEDIEVVDPNQVKMDL